MKIGRTQLESTVRRLMLEHKYKEWQDKQTLLIRSNKTTKQILEEGLGAKKENGEPKAKPEKPSNAPKVCLLG